MIRLLERISVPNHSRNSLILFKLNTLYSCKECIRAIWSKWYNSLNWTYLYCRCFPSISGFDSSSSANFRPESLQKFIILFKLNTLYSCKECIIGVSGIIHLLDIFYDADVFKFRVLIRLLERISVPNHSRDSFILFKLNTLYSCKECIRAIWSKWYNSLNWTYLYDADVFHQFRVLIRLLEPFPSRITPEIH